ncbi:MAG: glycosyltransferase family 4 protein [Planctomycetes bacterium]|nr:glycosyltransferase family 4 protein [Planctomycetota bacterium]
MPAFLYKLIGPSVWRMPLAAIISAAAAYLLCFPLRRISVRLKLMDNPSERSSHTIPTPRTGGVAIVLGALVGVLFVFSPTWSFLITIGIGALVALASFVDDIWPIPPLPRIVAHVLVAFLCIRMIGLAPHDLGLPYLTIDITGWVGVFIATLFVVAFVNFYNFMDGIDGQAATQGMFGGITIALLLLYAHSGNSVFSAAALAGACMGFVPHNTSSDNKLFMGDTGSTTLGFGFAMLTLIGGARTQVPWVAFILPWALFIYDPVFSIIKRILQGANPTKPHREFHFHLLVRCGWSHARVTRVQDILILTCCLGGWIYAWHTDWVRLVVLCLLAVMFAGYSIWVHWYFARHCQDKLSQNGGHKEDPQTGNVQLPTDVPAEI